MGPVIYNAHIGLVEKKTFMIVGCDSKKRIIQIENWVTDREGD